MLSEENPDRSVSDKAEWTFWLSLIRWQKTARSIFEILKLRGEIVRVLGRKNQLIVNMAGSLQRKEK